MFVGHYGVAFAAKRMAPKTSLGTLLAAALFIDLLWPIFLLLGWEKVRIDPGNTAFTPLDFVSYPLSHSLVTCAGWGLLFGVFYWVRTRYRAGAIVAGLLVLSHWILDAVTHRPDLPIYPGGSTMIGFGLWNSVTATLLIEGAIFVIGVWLYLSGTQTNDKVGHYSLWVFLLLTIIMYVGNAVGPPPPDARTLAWFALGIWLIPLWAGWFDRHRRLTGA